MRNCPQLQEASRLVIVVHSAALGAKRSALTRRWLVGSEQLATRGETKLSRRNRRVGGEWAAGSLAAHLAVTDLDRAGLCAEGVANSSQRQLPV